MDLIYFPDFHLRLLKKVQLIRFKKNNFRKREHRNLAVCHVIYIHKWEFFQRPVIN